MSVLSFSQGVTTLASGTSVSSPSFASVIALLNDRLVAARKPVLGFLNPFLYSTGSGAFTSITLGKNPGVTCPENAVSENLRVGECAPS